MLAMVDLIKLQNKMITLVDKVSKSPCSGLPKRTLSSQRLPFHNIIYVVFVI